MNERILANFTVALEAVLANKMRTILTALGIIFGVAAVIAMLAIGAGAQQEILEQIKLVGVNNIVITPVVEQKEENLDEQGGSKEEKKKFTPGLSLQDVDAISEVVPFVTRSSPEIVLETFIIKNGLRRSAKLVGVEPSYFELSSFMLGSGRMFNEDEMLKGMPVCVIGKAINTKFFPTENPIGKDIKCGSQWLKVIGVLDERYISKSSISKLGIRDYNMDVYIPVRTALIRFKDRQKVTRDMLRRANSRSRGRFFFISNNNDDESSSDNTNYHQLDRLTIQVEDTEMLTPVADIVSRLLERRHNNVIDYEITIPELLLKQQQKTKSIFNFVLGAIAGISLLVGGIGIMNIMLASVLERIKEIGLRLSLGAKKTDIVIQFVCEAVMISVSGGLIGVILGVGIALIVSHFAEIPTVITFISIILSFGVAAAVGLIFGITPARRAANQDPITSLRYE